jgi:hypothetical protein
VSITPEVSSVAPSSSTSTATETAKPGSFLEKHVGEIVAAAAGVLAEAVQEYKDRGLTPKTKGQGGELIWQLYRLRASMIGIWDFDSVARQRGIEALRAATDGELTPRTVDLLVDEVLTILRKVVADNLN